MTAERLPARLCALALMLALAAAAAAGTVPLDGPLAPRTLTVLRLIDPRFAAPGQPTWDRSKAEAEALFARLFGTVVQLRDVGEVTPQQWLAHRGIATGEPEKGL